MSGMGVSRRRRFAAPELSRHGSVTPADCRYVRHQFDLSLAEMGEFLRVSDTIVKNYEDGRTEVPGLVVEVYEALFRGLARFSRPVQPTGPVVLDRGAWRELDAGDTFVGHGHDPRAVIWGPSPAWHGQRILRVFSAAYGFGLDAEPGHCIAGTCADPTPRGTPEKRR